MSDDEAGREISGLPATPKTWSSSALLTAVCSGLLFGGAAVGIGWGIASDGEQQPPTQPPTKTYSDDECARFAGLAARGQAQSQALYDRYCR